MNELELDIVNVMSSWPDLLFENENYVNYVIPRCENNVKLMGVKCYVDEYYVNLNASTSNSNNSKSCTDTQCHLPSVPVIPVKSNLSSKDSNLNIPLHHFENNVKLLGVKCHVEEYFVNLKASNCTVESIVDTQNHILSTQVKAIKPKFQSQDSNKIKCVKSTVKPLNVNKKAKKISPNKPENIKKFLERMKLRKSEKPSKLPTNRPSSENRTCSRPKTLKSQTENIDIIEVKEQPINTGLDKNRSINNQGNELDVNFSENLGKIGLNCPNKISQNATKMNPNGRQKLQCFSDIKSYLSMSPSLVGSSNTKVFEKPQLDVKVGRSRRRGKPKKKEEELVETSLRTIKSYFPKVEDLVLCENGKRKRNESTSIENKKQKVGNQSK